MAIAFEPFHRVALIMEPTKYTLNHLLYRTVSITISLNKEIAANVSLFAEGKYRLHSRRSNS